MMDSISRPASSNPTEDNLKTPHQLNQENFDSV